MSKMPALTEAADDESVEDENGWMVKVKISGDLPSDLMSSEEYSELVGKN